MGLQDNTKYTVRIPAGVAEQCTKNARGTDCTVAVGAAKNNGSNTYTFTVLNTPARTTASSSAASTVRSGNGDVPFSVTFSRKVVAKSNAETYISATTDDRSRLLTVRDVTYGDTRWTVTVAGINGSPIIFNVLAGAGTGLAGQPTAASTPADLTRNLAFLQNCETKETAGAMSACVNNMQTQTYTTSIVKESMFGGAACPSVLTRTVNSGCVSPTNAPASRLINSCSGRCNAIADGTTTSCSCDAFCIFSADCCSDLKATCPNQMPTCGGDSSLECGMKALANTGAVLCSCDGGCTAAGNCCDGFRDGCANKLCSVKYPQGIGATPSWCTRKYNPATDEGQPCSCDDECNINGDCCADFAHTCKQRTVCAKSFNCGFAFLTSSFQEYGCACDHSCIAGGDCCEDYERVCEVFATCEGSCGSSPWDTRGCIPQMQYEDIDPNCDTYPGVSGFTWDYTKTMDRWCGCDSGCEPAGDCCADKATACSSNSRDRG